MPKTLFTEGHLREFEMMMQEVPRGYKVWYEDDIPVNYSNTNAKKLSGGGGKNDLGKTQKSRIAK